MSAPEDTLAFQLKAVGIPHSREYRFDPTRRWRADFLIASNMTLPLLIEVDGGSWVAGRHTTGAGFERDCEKLNAATMAGYRILRFTPAMVESGVALQTIEKALS